MNKKYAAVLAGLGLLGCDRTIDTQSTLNEPAQSAESTAQPENRYYERQAEINEERLQYQILRLEEQCENLNDTNARQRERISAIIEQLRESSIEHQRLITEFISSLEDPFYNGDQYRCPIIIRNTNPDGTPYLRDRLNLELRLQGREADALLYQITWTSLTRTSTIISEHWNRVELENNIARITITPEDLPTARTPELLSGTYELRVVHEGSENDRTAIGRPPLPAEYKFVHIPGTN